MQNTQIRQAVQFFYDLQKLRIETGNRAQNDGDNDAPPAVLDEHDKAFFEKAAAGMENLEKQALKYVAHHTHRHPMAEWLLAQKGVGPTMAGVILASFDIERADTPSKFWAYAGLAVDPQTGRAVRRVKGQKANFDPWLKSKLVKVLAECLIKTNSPWRSFYDNYKHRKRSERVPVCMACAGTGHFSDPDAEKKPAKVTKTKPPKASSKCANCNGTGGPAPWGRSDAHRDVASKRYMIKMLLLELWKRWRLAEGLPVRPSYMEERLGIVHHTSP